MTLALMAHAKQARKPYFGDQEKRASAKIRSEKEGTLEAIAAEIASFNQKNKSPRQNHQNVEGEDSWMQEKQASWKWTR